MKKLRKGTILIGTIIIVFVFAGLMGCSTKVETDTKTINSKNLQDTQITSILQEPIPEQKNLIYCSTFQLAWNELKTDIIKEPIQLVNQPPEVNYLNLPLVTKDDLSSKDYVAMAGFGKDKVVDKINQELKTKFGEKAEVLTNEYKDDDMILAYAFLYKQLKFPYEFQTLERGMYFNTYNEPTKVRGFGVNYGTTHEEFEKIVKQVNIYDYRDPENLIISIDTNGGKEDLVLAKVDPKATLYETYQTVAKRLTKGTKQKLAYGDKLTIPVINFNIEHAFENLQKKPFENKGFKDLQIDEAKQFIIFKLNEKGATLKSEASVTVKQALFESKSLVFDKPFLLYLKEKSAKYPYLALWINNPELLVTEHEE